MRSRSKKLMHLLVFGIHRQRERASSLAALKTVSIVSVNLRSMCGWRFTTPYRTRESNGFLLYRIFRLVPSLRLRLPLIPRILPSDWLPPRASLVNPSLGLVSAKSFSKGSAIFAEPSGFGNTYFESPPIFELS